MPYRYWHAGAWGGLHVLSAWLNCSDEAASAVLHCSAFAGVRRRKSSTLADHQRIVDLWHPTKNGTDLPADYSHGSMKRVWMRCHGCPNCGEVHEWESSANRLSLAASTLGCRACTSVRAFCSCRAISANKRLAAEWHEDNPAPTTIPQGSGNKYKWRCSDAACGHVWVAMPSQRSKVGGNNCPASDRRARNHTLHPSVALGRPELLAEWDKGKNTVLATDVRCGSGKLVWWLCRECGHSYEAVVYLRAVKGHGCPSCSKGTRS